jgi:hypothetical protein
LVRAREQIAQGVGGLVRHAACEAKHLVEAELSFSEQLRHRSRARRDRGEQVGARRLVLLAVGEILRQSPKIVQFRLDTRGRHPSSGFAPTSRKRPTSEAFRGLRAGRS